MLLETFSQNYWNKLKCDFLDLIGTFCKHGKNRDRIHRCLASFSIDIVLTNDCTNGERVSLCKEKFHHSLIIGLKLLNDALQANSSFKRWGKVVL